MNSYAVLGEDDSDAATLRVIVRRLLGDAGCNTNRKIQPKGFGGCGGLLRKGANHLRLLQRLGYQWFVICHDADGSNPSQARMAVQTRVIQPSGVANACCVVVPVQELEAWILADLGAVSSVITSWRPARSFPSPENVPSPKELLEQMSNDEGKKPRYSHATHNERVAEFLSLTTVAQKCASFVPLRDFILGTV